MNSSIIFYVSLLVSLKTECFKSYREKRPVVSYNRYLIGFEEMGEKPLVQQQCWENVTIETRLNHQGVLFIINALGKSH